MNPRMRNSWTAQNLRVMHFLLAENAIMSSLAAFRTRVKQDTWGITPQLFHQKYRGLLEGWSLSSKCCSVLASVCREWQACILRLVVGGAEIRITSMEAVAMQNDLHYTSYWDTTEGLHISCSGAVCRTLAESSYRSSEKKGPLHFACFLPAFP